MRIPFTVHTVGNDKVPTQVELDGETITADVKVVTIELVSATCTLMLRVSPNDPLAAAEIGATIVGTFEIEESPE